MSARHSSPDRHRHRYSDSRRDRHRSRSPDSRRDRDDYDKRRRERDSDRRYNDRSNRAVKDERDLHHSSHQTDRDDSRSSPERRDERKEHVPRPDRMPGQQDRKKVEEKQKPNMQQSGRLAEDTNKFNGVLVKYNEPADAKQPKRKWRLYPFKGEESLDFIPIHNQSAYLLGRDRRVADIPIDHPSCSLQHAAIQFRAVQFERSDGSVGKRVRPYVIDLESSNGTYLNNKRIEARKFVELFEKDVIKFGFSTRDYVVLHEDLTESDELKE